MSAWALLRISKTVEIGGGLIVGNGRVGDQDFDRAIVETVRSKIKEIKTLQT